MAVLFGGRSAEHEVSCASAASILGALDPQRYEAVPIGIDRQGRWHRLGGPPVAALGGLPSVEPSKGVEVVLSQRPGAAVIVAADQGAGEDEHFDVVFPVLHGPLGEDGTIQGFLEMAGVPYVGAGVLASAIGMDKAVQKVLFAAAGLPVVEHVVVRETEWRDDREGLEAAVDRLGYPVFTKPAALGSSVGITKVKTPDQLSGAVEAALAHGPKALVERAVEAREIECGVLGNEEPVASLPGEIVPSAEFYDYDAKYLDDSTKLVVPADLPPEVALEVQRLSVAAFRAVEAEGMARVDFFLDPGGRLLVNEINTIPGFTEMSMYPRLWMASGVDYPDLIDRLLKLALERHGRAARASGA